MKIKKIISIILMAFLAVGCAGCGGNPPDDSGGDLGNGGNEVTTDTTFYEDAPSVYECDDPSLQSPGVKAIFYENVDYHGEKTRVFAYMGIPSNASENNQVPGVVLLHGGGGTAYSEWVQLWNQRGYAAIAMDLEGHLPNGKSHAYSGPARDGNFADVSKETKDNQWWHHAVSAARGALKVLGNEAAVKGSKVGLAGISWGGVIASFTIGYEQRFAFAAMIYGCGYLNESESYFGNLNADSAYMGNQIDASHRFANVTMPTFWINSDNDPHFSANITSKSAQHTFGATICLKPFFPHSHQAGWAAQEVYEFADSVVKEGNKLAVLDEPFIDGNTIGVTIKPNGRTIHKVTLVYTVENSHKTWQDDAWVEVEMSLMGNTATATLPVNVKSLYMYVTDKAGRSTSTVIYDI